MKSSRKKQIDPSKIMQVGMGFWPSKTLLTAVKLGLFTLLANTKLTGQQIKSELQLHGRGLYDFLDSLVALGFLHREGLEESAVYRNAEDVDRYLDKNKSTYIGGILEMADNRLYSFWHDLEEGLKTGLPQNETKTGGHPIFEELYADKKKLTEFLKAMGGAQMGNFIVFAKKFDFSDYSTLCDVGGGSGYLAAQVVLHNPHIRCTSFDLPPVTPLAAETVEKMGLTDNIRVKSGDFFKDDIPTADVITMGNILHDWGLEDKKMLIKKAYDALPVDGAYVVIEDIIDTSRKENLFGLLMSLNMLIETPEGYNFTMDDFSQWAKGAGFREIFRMPLTGPSSAAVAIK